MRKGGHDQYQTPIAELEPRIFLTVREELEAKTDQELADKRVRAIADMVVGGGVAAVYGVGTYTYAKLGLEQQAYGVGTDERAVRLSLAAGFGALAVGGLSRAVKSAYGWLRVNAVMRRRASAVRRDREAL